MIRENAWEKGYLTVYVALSLAVLLSLFLTVLEGIRQNAILLEAELITDIGLDSVLAEYHRELLEQYNLFFIDTFYGTKEASAEMLQQHLFRYIDKNCGGKDDLPEGLLYRDLLALRAGSVGICKTAVATDKDGRIFRNRAAEAVKDDIGAAYLQKILSWMDIVEENGLNDRNIEQEKREIDDEIFSYDGSERFVDEEWVKLEVENVTEPLEMQKQRGILQLVIEDASVISAMGTDTQGLISARRSRGLVNRGNWEETDEAEETLFDRLMFLEYALRYCSSFTDPLEKGLLKYQSEYLIAGQNNDIDNLKSVVYRLSAVREAANALYIFTDTAKCAQAEAVALAAAALMLLPEIAPLLQASILLGWAYAESLYDVRCLLEGGKVPLLKTAETWHSDIGCVTEGIFNFGSGLTDDGNTDEGLSYKEYLRILLLMAPLEETTFRLMDIVEMDIRQTAGNQFFRIDNCIDRLEAQVQIHSSYGYSVSVARSKMY